MVGSDTDDPGGTSATRVTLHPLVAADLPAVATLYIAAVQDDELFAFLWPYLHSCLESFRSHSLAKLKQQRHSPDTCMFVAKVDGRIVGYSAWKRIGNRYGNAWAGIRETIYSACKFSLQLKLIVPTRMQARRAGPMITLTACFSRRHRDLPTQTGGVIQRYTLLPTGHALYKTNGLQRVSEAATRCIRIHIRALVS